MIAWSAGNSDWSTSTGHVRPVGGGTDHALSDQPVKGDQALLSFSPDARYLLVDSLATYAQFTCCKNSTALVYSPGGGAGRQIAADAIYRASASARSEQCAGELPTGRSYPRVIRAQDVEILDEAVTHAVAVVAARAAQRV
jgi:hypothetical protein